MGFIDVEEMLSKISAKKFIRWVAFLNIDPQGERRADLRTGIIASTLANINKKKDTKAYDASDFMPSFKAYEIKAKQSKGGQTLEQMKSILLSIHKTNKKIKRTPAEEAKIQRKKDNAKRIREEKKKKRQEAKLEAQRKADIDVN